MLSANRFIFKFFSAYQKHKERGDDNGRRLEKKYCAR